MRRGLIFKNKEAFLVATDYLPNASRFTLDRADLVLEDGKRAPFKNKRPWIIEALRCYGLAFNIFKSTQLGDQRVAILLRLNRLIQVIKSSPWYPPAQEVLDNEKQTPIQLSASPQAQSVPAAPSAAEIPTIFSAPSGLKVEFSQSPDVDWVKVVIMPPISKPSNLEVYRKAKNQNNGGRPDLGSGPPPVRAGTHYQSGFPGKLKDVSLAIREKVLELFSNIDDKIKGYSQFDIISSSSVFFYINEFGSIKNVHDFVSMLQHRFREVSRF